MFGGLDQVFLCIDMVICDIRVAILVILVVKVHVPIVSPRSAVRF